MPGKKKKQTSAAAAAAPAKKSVKPDSKSGAVPPPAATSASASAAASAGGVIEITIRSLTGATTPIRIKPNDGTLTWRELMKRDFVEGKSDESVSAYLRGGKAICRDQLVSAAGFTHGESVFCILALGAGIRPPPTLIAGIDYRYVPNVVPALCAAIGDGFAPELAAIINDYLPYQKRHASGTLLPELSPMCSASRHSSRNTEEKCGACNRYRYERVEIETVRIDSQPKATAASEGIRGLQIIVSLNSMIGYSNKKLVSYDFNSVNKSAPIQIPLAVVHHKTTPTAAAASTSLALPAHKSADDSDEDDSGGRKDKKGKDKKVSATQRAGHFLRLITDQLKSRADTERRMVGSFTAAAPPVPDDDDVDDYSRDGTVTPGGDLIWTLNAAQSGGGCGVGCYTVMIDEASLPWIGSVPPSIGPVAWQFTVGMPPPK